MKFFIIPSSWERAGREEGIIDKTQRLEKLAKKKTFSFKIFRFWRAQNLVSKNRQKQHGIHG